MFVINSFPWTDSKLIDRYSCFARSSALTMEVHGEYNCMFVCRYLLSYFPLNTPHEFRVVSVSCLGGQQVHYWCLMDRLSPKCSCPWDSWQQMTSIMDKLTSYFRWWIRTNFHQSGWGKFILLWSDYMPS